MSTEQQKTSTGSASSHCSDAFWPRGANEHTFETLQQRLLWQIGMIEGPSQFEFEHTHKIEFEISSSFIEPGSDVVIRWTGGYSDYGYIFTLPGFEGNDCYMAGVIHVPSPKNDGGKGAIDPLWLTLDELLRLPELKSIVI